MSADAVAHRRQVPHVVRAHTAGGHRVPDMMLSVVGSVLVVALAISQIASFGWVGTAAAFVVLLAAMGIVIGVAFRMLGQGDPDDQRGGPSSC